MPDKPKSEHQKRFEETMRKVLTTPKDAKAPPRETNKSKPKTHQ